MVYKGCWGTPPALMSLIRGFLHIIHGDQFVELFSVHPPSDPLVVWIVVSNRDRTKSISRNTTSLSSAYS